MHFHVVGVQKRAKKCTKERDARAKFLLCLKQYKAYCFLTFSLPSGGVDCRLRPL